MVKTLEDGLVRTVAAQSTSVNEVASKLSVHYSVAKRELERLGLHLAEPEDPLPETQGLSDEQMIKLLQKKGYRLDTDVTPTEGTWTYALPEQPGGVRSHRFGWVSDTHICSRYQQLTHLHTAYSEMKQEGCEFVLHTGDLTAGNGKMYRGQIYEIYRHGIPKQVEEAVQVYPDHLPTILISGNHDLSWKVDTGVDVVAEIASQRSDFTYVGMYGETFELDGVKIYLHHGDGGVSYARSYKMQKIIEQMAPANKPHIYLGGHYHITCELKNYRNVYGIFGGCFEMQTPYLLRKGLNPEVGYHILDVKRDDAGIRSVRTEWRPFMTHIREDH